MAPKIGVRSGGDSVYLRVHTGFDALTMRPTNLLRWTVLWAGLLLMGGSVGAQRVFGPPALQRMQEGHAACGKGLVGVPVDAFTRIGPPATYDPDGPRTASILVNYLGTTPPAVVSAFNYAKDLWADALSTPVTIRINVSWSALSGGTLAQAGPSTLHQDFPGAPFPTTYYPAALANRLAGTDLSPQNDLACTFNSSANWYLGTDGYPPPGQYDFVTAALHEIGHGLGFIGSAYWTNGFGFLGTAGVPYVYDQFTETQLGADLLGLENGSTALGTALVSNALYWDGPEGIEAGGGIRPRLYAPGLYEPGSSYSHLNESSYPAGNVNALMTPALNSAEANHDPGPMLLAMFRDMGWAAGECLISDVSVGVQSPCLPTTNTYSQTLTVTFENAPSSGTLLVNGQAFTLGTSPRTLTLTNLPSDGLPVDLSVSFSGDSACSYLIPEAFTAPISCCGQLRLRTVDPAADQVGLRLLGTCASSMSGWSLRSGSATWPLPDTLLTSGALLTVACPGWNPPSAGGELLLVRPDGSAADYVRWSASSGGGEAANAAAAVAAGIWSAGSYVAAFPVLNYIGFTAHGAAYWTGTPIPCAILSIAAAGPPSACDPATNDFSASVTVTFQGAPSAGSLVVNGASFPIGTSPRTVTLPSLNSTGQPVAVSAYFSTQPACDASFSGVLVAPAACDCPMDLSGNRIIEVADILALLADFGCSGACPADLNGDGTVAVADVLLLLAAFGEGCE